MSKLENTNMMQAVICAYEKCLVLSEKYYLKWSTILIIPFENGCQWLLVTRVVVWYVMVC